VSQVNADYYEDEVAQLNASPEVADLETKIMVNGKTTREWDIDYWLGQMKSMMHTTPAVTFKLWEYAMDKAQAGKVEAQAEQDKVKLKRTKRKPDRVTRTISKLSKKSWRRK
jgi:hypothetical protein